MSAVNHALGERRRPFLNPALSSYYGVARAALSSPKAPPSRLRQLGNGRSVSSGVELGLRGVDQLLRGGNTGAERRDRRTG